MSRLTVSALCACLLASSYARAESLDSLRLDYERMRTTYDDHCRDFVAAGTAGSSTHERIAENLLGRLQRPIDALDSRIGERLQFLSNPEAAVSRYAETLRTRHLAEVQELETLRSRGHDFGSVEAQRIRVRQARMRWEEINGTPNDRSGAEAYTRRWVDSANAELVELRELRQDFDRLQRNTRACESLAASRVRWAADPDPTPEKPLPHVTAPGVGGWSPWAGGGATGAE